MERAIHHINGLIQYYENEMNRWIKFFESQEYIENTGEGSKEFAIEHTKKLYSELIDEIKQAVKILGDVK